MTKEQQRLEEARGSNVPYDELVKTNHQRTEQIIEMGKRAAVVELGPQRENRPVTKTARVRP